jgi:hypothetical protein
MGRPRSRRKRSPLVIESGVAREEGVAKVSSNRWGGVRGIGGDSTIIMRSLRRVLCGAFLLGGLSVDSQMKYFLLLSSNG